MRGRGGKGGELNGFLDAGSRVEGELSFEDTFRIDGRFHGRIRCRGTLIVGEHGHVDADIEVGRLFVHGEVRGQVKAFQRIEVVASGRLVADIQTPALVIEEAGFFQGRCAMDEARASARPAVLPSPATVRGG